LKDLGRYALVLARQNIEKPTLAIALLGFRDTLHAVIIKLLHFGALLRAFLSNCLDINTFRLQEKYELYKD
jgi:hypothetical protein